MREDAGQGRAGQGSRAGSRVNSVRDRGAKSKMWAGGEWRRRATDEHRGGGRAAVDVFARWSERGAEGDGCLSRGVSHDDEPQAACPSAP